MTDDITNDLALLDDWLAGKGYGEEAGLCMRAMDLIRKQADEIEKLREAIYEKETVAEIRAVASHKNYVGKMMGYWSGIRPDICIALRIIALHERYRCDQEFLEKMMTDDIVKRLRIDWEDCGDPIFRQAADEIEKLREARDASRMEVIDVVRENEKLRAALKPFADVKVYPVLEDTTRVYDEPITYGDIRAARAALEKKDG